MKTERYADETENFNKENKNELEITYLTKAKSDVIQDVLRHVAEATLQSGMRFMKVVLDEEKGKEQVFLDAEDASASVVANVVSDVQQIDENLKFRGTRQSMDNLAIIYEDESLIKEAEKDKDEVEQ